MALRVISPGVCATIQDAGRTGFRAWGVPVGGAFDRGMLALANALLGNEADAAALELTIVGGVYEAESPLALALAGAPMEGHIEARDGSITRATAPQSFSLQAGERLVLGGCPFGARCYLAVQGGWQTPVVLGSRSSEPRLRSGESLAARSGSTPIRWLADGGMTDPTGEPIRLVAGPDLSLLRSTLEANTFTVGQESDRMGLRLKGGPIEITSPPERISAPVAPGAVQVAGGALIILGVACGTMGGYPHVAHVISADLDRLGQLRPGDTVQFHQVSLEEARELDRIDRQEREARYVRIAALAGN